MTMHSNGTVPNGGPRTTDEPMDTKSRPLIGNGHHAKNVVISVIICE